MILLWKERTQFQLLLQERTNTKRPVVHQQIAEARDREDRTATITNNK